MNPFTVYLIFSLKGKHRDIELILKFSKNSKCHYLPTLMSLKTSCYILCKIMTELPIPVIILACSTANCSFHILSFERSIGIQIFPIFLLYLQLQTNEVVSITFLSPNSSSESLSLLFVNL